MITNTKEDILKKFVNDDVTESLKHIIDEFDGYVPKIYYSYNYGISLVLNDLESITIYNGFVDTRNKNIDSLLNDIYKYIDYVNKKYLSDSLSIQLILDNPFYINDLNIRDVFDNLISEKNVHLFNLILSKYHYEIIQEIFSNFYLNKVFYKIITNFMINNKISLNIIFNDVLNFIGPDSADAKVILDSFKDNKMKVSILANKFIKYVSEDQKNGTIDLINNLYGTGTIK